MIAVTPYLVLAAVYALACGLLSLGVAVSWHAGVQRRRASAGELLTLRLLPAVGAAFLTLSVALPAFLLHEPVHESERGGPLVASLALLALAAVLHGLVRCWRACSATRALLRRCGPATDSRVAAGRAIEFIDMPDPVAAVVGAWRPRILVAAGLRAACSDEEFRQIIAHEAAHETARDNLKLLLQILCPDVLAWLPAGTALTERWRAAAELEADARASGGDPRKRLALASALLKVARLSSGPPRRSLALSLRVAGADVEQRVRELLAPLAAAAAPTRSRAQIFAAVALVSLALAGMPLYAGIQTAIEALVQFGR
jgi:Zn-dependent protease with chaperone function